MRIIKKADVSNWSHKHICTNCDSELEVELKDLKYTYYSGDMRESSSESFSAICVVCGESFSIKNDLIPKLIKAEMRKKHKDAKYSSQGSYWDR